jgi:hypothetical protein
MSAPKTFSHPPIQTCTPDDIRAEAPPSSEGDVDPGLAYEPPRSADGTSAEAGNLFNGLFDAEEEKQFVEDIRFLVPHFKEGQFGPAFRHVRQMAEKDAEENGRPLYMQRGPERELCKVPLSNEDVKRFARDSVADWKSGKPASGTKTK